MDIFSKNKFLAWVIVILVVLNVVTLGSLWLQKERPNHEYPGRLPEREKQRQSGDFFSKELGLDDEQTKQLETLREEHRTAADKLIGEMRDSREQLFDLLKSDSPDMSKVSDLENTIGQKTTELEKATFEHFTKVRALCNDEQKKKFDELIGDIMKMAGPQPGPGGPQGGPQDGPPDGRMKGPHGNRPPGEGPPPGQGPPPGR